MLFDRLRALQEDLLARLSEPVVPKEPKARAILDPNLLAEISEAFCANDWLNRLWELATKTQDPVACVWIQDLLQAKIQQNPTALAEPKVMRAALLSDAQEKLNALTEVSEAGTRAQQRLLCSQIELQLKDNYSFGDTWKALEQVLRLDPDLNSLTGEEIGALLTNGLQLVRRLGTREQVNEFLLFVEHYLTNHLETIPELFRVQIVTRLAAINDDFGMSRLTKLRDASQNLDENQALDEGERENLKDNEQELALMECLVLAGISEDMGPQSYADAKASFKSKFGFGQSPRFVESWTQILVEEGLASRRREPIQEAFDLLQTSGQHEFLLAEAQVRIVDEWPEFFATDEERQQVILDAWRPIENALGGNIMSLISRTMDEADAGAQVNAVIDGKVLDLLGRALEFLNEFDDVPPLLQQLFRVMVLHFGQNLRRVQTPLDVIRGATKKSFLRLYQKREQAFYQQPEVEGRLQDILEIEPIVVRSRTAADPDVMQSKSCFLDFKSTPASEELPTAIAQEIVIPLDDQQVAVLRKRGLPPVSETELYWAAKFLRNQYNAGISQAFSGENTWEAMVRPEPEFRVLTRENMEAYLADNVPWLRLQDEVHYKEAGVDLIPDEDIFWVAVVEAQTQILLGAQSINRVDADNYAFTLPGLRDSGPEACLDYLRKFLETPDLEFENLVEITNMAVVFRYLQAEVMTYMFYHTAQTILEKGYHPWVVITIQAMLQRTYKALELDFRVFMPDVDYSTNTVDGRIERNEKLGAFREVGWTGRGGSQKEVKTRGGVVSMPSALRSFQIKAGVDALQGPVDH